MNLKFAYHFIKYPYGVAEYVMVITEKFSFLVDFVIVDMPEDEETTLILNRPFLLTSRCNIDVKKCTFTLKAYDDEITLNVPENRKQV